MRRRYPRDPLDTGVALRSLAWIYKNISPLDGRDFADLPIKPLCGLRSVFPARLYNADGKSVGLPVGLWGRQTFAK